MGRVVGGVFARTMLISFQKNKKQNFWLIPGSAGLSSITASPTTEQYGNAADQTAVPQIAAEAWSCWWEATTGCSGMLPMLSSFV
ncbi:hypothetical protein Nepgr_033518 [Nepenthes gracilis]|uniref:Uncharacterized protein n=1 Tax=Nepenthes gracilis TaxID=150966 RepID=A0AAD3TM05_NEPGR|nr:hypothetical protein Nepgr_033518 [Nepenthes gracilis]